MATIGQALTAPEAGWRRYDNNYMALQYSSNWTFATNSLADYGSTNCYTNTVGSTLTFKFKGTKLRIITITDTNRDTAVQITIDGVVATYSENATTARQVLVYEKTGLTDAIHTVEIKKTQTGTGYISLDAVDIDDTGILGLFPATAGQLRTKITDMQIGDFIACNYKAASGAVGTFDKLGGLVGSDIPVAGSATPDGAFYLVKIDKGLLCSDRVVQNSITWDALNTGKLIQGKLWDASIIPVMTSNTAPSGVASASSVYSTSTNDAWTAFNGNTNEVGWASATVTTAWLAYQFPSPTMVTAYSITCRSDDTTNAPVDFTFEGSNDGGVTWTVLDTHIGVTGWVAGGNKSFLFKNTSSFTRYRINITKNNGGPGISIAELKMMTVASFIRSLTGGVAYADANGASTTTDKSLGAFPTNNEWDKYITKFPANKIQAGKTLDDVFHWSNLYSWTQDTPAVGLAANTMRTVRGKASIDRWAWSASASATVDFGYRPVFEYKEV